MLSLLLNHSVSVLPVPEIPPYATLSALDDFNVYSEKPLILNGNASRRTVAEDLNDLQRKALQPKVEPQPYQSNSNQRNHVRARSSGDGKTPGQIFPGKTSREAHENLLSIPLPSTTLDHNEVTTILSAQRRRCQEGYLFDCVRNQRIVANDPWLVELWELVRRLEDLAKNDGMVSDPLDLSYLGVCAIWENSPGSIWSRNRFFNPGPFSQSLFADAVSNICQQKGYPPFEDVQTGFPKHRQLCLAISGWSFSKEEVRRRCHELMAQREYYKSIVLAVFHGRKDVALDLLKECIQQKRMENIGLGAVIACESVNKEQRELCAWMAEESDDPYLRALLAYFVTGDWNSVLEMEQLSLYDRVGVALRNLDDNRLSSFLRLATSKAVAEGDIEGILLTGLGEQGIDLFQSYITKFNDLQTAVLVMAFTNPRYVVDVRWEYWKETYFMQMQAWRAFTERTRFIVHHDRKSVNRDNRELNETPPRQVTLRCNHCLGSLARREKNGTGLENGHRRSFTELKSIRNPGASSGIVCPRCGRHMPRCGICMMWLGTPDPSKPGGAAALAKEDLMAKFIMSCMTCNHGFHAHHARDWFVKHQMCPVPDCQCLCGLKH